MSEYVHKSHNVTALIYHLVFPVEYRRVVFDQDVDEVMKRVCIEIEKRYQMKFLEIGTDADHVHFLVQSVPTYSLTRIVSINMAKEAMVERSFSLNSLSFKDVISMICLLMPY